MKSNSFTAIVHHARVGVALSLSLAFSSLSLGQSNYAAFELKRENNWETLVAEDMDGDGLKDLVFSHYDENNGRELHIHKQQLDGSFSSQPQRVEIKREIIGIGFADLRSEPGMEILLFANSGVFSLSTNKQGYSGNLKPLLQWELIAATPDAEQVQFLNPSIDINGDGHIDLLLPGRDKYGLFLGGPGETFALHSQFNPASEQAGSAARRRSELGASIGINAKDGVQLEFNAETSSPLQDFVEQLSQADAEPEDLLRTDNWLPNAMLLKLNDDALLDVLYLNQGADGLGQLNVHYQSIPDGFTEIADWKGSLDTRGDLQLADINGDNLVDLIKVKGDGNNWNASFYINHNGEFDLNKPDQIMRFTGYDLRLNFIRLKSETKPILSASYYTIPVVDAIRNASLNRTQLLYNFNDQTSAGLFSQRPTAKLEESFSAANVRGLSEQLTLSYDVNGDGLADALYITENGTLAAKAIGENLTIAKEPFWEYIAANTVFEFEVLHLNEDARPDLILTHGNTRTVLVALP